MERRYKLLLIVMHGKAFVDFNSG